MAGTSYAAKYMENPKSQGLPGVITLEADVLKWAPNNPDAAPQLNLDLKAVKSIRASKDVPGKKTKALLNLDIVKQYYFEFKNFEDRDGCRNFVSKFVPASGNQPSTSVKQVSDKQQSSNKRTDNEPSTSGRPQTKKHKVSENPQQASTSTSQSARAAEFSRRMKMLQEDGELQLLHRRLVQTKVLTEEEFWTDRKRSEAYSRKQSTGWKNDMIGEVKGDVDGRANTVSFQLTPEIIHQIFAEKPLVHNAFLEFVPSKMTESEFWTKYCRAELLNKKNDAARRAEADVDEDLATFLNEDVFISKETNRKIRRVDPTLDMASDASDYVALPGHGIFRDGTKEPDPTTAKNKLMRTINRHAEVVLAGRQNLQVDTMDTMSVARALQEQSTTMDVDEPPEIREERIHSMTELEDLHGPTGPALMPLSIQDPRKYFDVQKSGTGASCSTQDPSVALERFKKQIHICQNPNFQGPSKVCGKVLQELTNAISTAKHPLGKTAEKNVLDILPTRVREQLLEYAKTIFELLRHFWATYPITSAAFESKAARLKDKIQKLYTEIQNMKNSTQVEHRHQVSLILQPMIQTLDAALAHYESEASNISTRRQENGLESFGMAI